MTWNTLRVRNKQVMQCDSFQSFLMSPSWFYVYMWAEFKALAPSKTWLAFRNVSTVFFFYSLSHSLLWKNDFEAPIYICHHILCPLCRWLFVPFARCSFSVTIDLYLLHGLFTYSHKKQKQKQQPNTEQHQVLLTLWRTIFNCFHSLQYTDIDYFSLSLSLSAVWVCIIFYFSVCCVPDLDYRYTTFVQKHALRYYVSGSLTWSRIKFHYFRFYLVCLTPSHNFHCRILSTAVVVVVVAVLFSLV